MMKFFLDYVPFFFDSHGEPLTYEEKVNFGIGLLCVISVSAFLCLLSFVYFHIKRVKRIKRIKLSKKIKKITK